MVQGNEGFAVPEVAELFRIHCEEDQTVEALADAIGDVDASTISRLFNNPDRKPYRRTLYKIRRFLDDRRSPKPVARKAVAR